MPRHTMGLAIYRPTMYITPLILKEQQAGEDHGPKDKMAQVIVLSDEMKALDMIPCLPNSSDHLS